MSECNIGIILYEVPLGHSQVYRCKIRIPFFLVADAQPVPVAPFAVLVSFWAQCHHQVRQSWIHCRYCFYRSSCSL